MTTNLSKALDTLKEQVLNTYGDCNEEVKAYLANLIASGYITENLDDEVESGWENGDISDEAYEDYK